MKSPYVYPGLKNGWKPSLEELLRAVCNHYKIHQSHVQGRSRSYGRSGHFDCVTPRMVYCYLSRHCTERSLREIGLLIGGRDHTTVINAARKCSDRLSTDGDFRDDIEGLLSRYGAPMPEVLGKKSENIFT